MKNSGAVRQPRGFIIVCVVLLALAALPLWSSARTLTPSITITNSSNRVIRHVFLSPPDADEWSANQLAENTTISAGQSVTINVTCDQQVKVIGEDQDGCFVSTVVACGDQSTWTITNDTAANCGQ